MYYHNKEEVLKYTKPLGVANHMAYYKSVV